MSRVRNKDHQSRQFWSCATAQTAKFYNRDKESRKQGLRASQESVMGKRAESFDWINWRFHDNDTELEQFNNQLNLTTLGSYAPGEAPTIFNPLVTLNPVPKATFVHETMHRELTRATTFGLFFEVIWSVRHVARFRKLAKVCYQHQWQVQEACATYAGLVLVAYYRPDYLSEAVRKLPSGKANQPPYREVFDVMAEIVPIVAGAKKSRLQGQEIFAGAIGHCSMNNDCLVRFADPEALDEHTLEKYLASASPNQRLRAILNAIRHHRARLDALIKRGHRDRTRGRVTPVRPAIAEIARLVPNVPIVQTFEEVRRQHALFRQGWEPIIPQLQADDYLNRDAIGRVPQIDVPEDYGSQPLTVQD